MSRPVSAEEFEQLTEFVVAFLASLPGVTGWALVLPGGYLLLVAVLALISALSTRPSRRDAAFRVLQLIWWSRRSRGEDDHRLPRGGEPPENLPRRRR